MPRLLIYDSELTGHHSDYLRAVFNYIVALQDTAPDSGIVFMVPAAMHEMLGGYTCSTGVSFRYLTDDELAKTGNTSKRKRSYLELDLILQAAEEHRVDEIFLMNLDYFQVALASKAVARTGCKISGILFQPYTRFERVATEHGFLPGEYSRALRKRFRLARLLRNPRVSRLCIPCDRVAVDTLNQRHGHKADFFMLPEPYFAGEIVESAQPEGNAPASVNLRLNYGIADDARIVLVFGHIIARKNVPNLLGALQSDLITYKGGIALLVIGDASDAYREKLEQDIDQFRQKEPALAETSGRPATQVVFDCSFADTATMNAAFAQTDMVAMPYFKAYQSSGILFLAARHRKPVITANAGLMNELVNEYGLGETADPLDKEAIAAAIDKLLHSSLHLDTGNAFFQQHTPDNHAACVLGLLPVNKSS